MTKHLVNLRNKTIYHVFWCIMVLDHWQGYDLWRHFHCGDKRCRHGWGGWHWSITLASWWTLILPIPLLEAQSAVWIGDPIGKGRLPFSFHFSFLSKTLLALLHTPEASKPDLFRQTFSGILVWWLVCTQLSIVLNHLWYCIFKL